MVKNIKEKRNKKEMGVNERKKMREWKETITGKHDVCHCMTVGTYCWDSAIYSLCLHVLILCNNCRKCFLMNFPRFLHCFLTCAHASITTSTIGYILSFLRHVTVNQHVYFVRNISYICDTMLESYKWRMVIMRQYP